VSAGEVTVVGAGVVGLTTAIALKAAGHRVRVLAAERPEATTSAAAGALWFPFQVGPPERVHGWARSTRTWLLELARTAPEAGVDLVSVTECADDPRRPWWAEAVDGLRLLDQRQPSGARYAWSFEAPRIEPALHLRWLESQLEAPLTLGRVERLEDVAGDGIVVNCSGIGARALAGDETLQSVLGQTVIAELGEVDPGHAYGDERNPEAMLYVIPRRQEVVIGGCALPFSGDRLPPPDPALRRAILDRAARAGIRHGRPLRDAVGLRPFRPSVRLERNGRVLHHYGHGGAGYTLAWGSAQDVAKLVSGRPPLAGQGDR
jgi:D-amino-acid oxidase